MNLDDLRPILDGYRAQVEPAWSAATAHEAYEGKPGNPTGQCGVTSAWLQKRLREDHGIETTYCIGEAFVLGAGDYHRHCWLELGLHRRVVLDITADQILGLQSRPVVCDFFGDLDAQRISYLARQVLTEDQVSRDPVASRLALLEVATA